MHPDFGTCFQATHIMQFLFLCRSWLALPFLFWVHQDGLFILSWPSPCWCGSAMVVVQECFLLEGLILHNQRRANLSCPPITHLWLPMIVAGQCAVSSVTKPASIFRTYGSTFLVSIVFQFVPHYHTINLAIMYPIAFYRAGICWNNPKLTWTLILMKITQWWHSLSIETESALRRVIFYQNT